MSVRLDLEPGEIQMLLSTASLGHAALTKKIVDQANAQQPDPGPPGTDPADPPAGKARGKNEAQRPN